MQIPLSAHVQVCPSVKHRVLVCNSYFARVGKTPGRVSGLSSERFFSAAIWINGTLLDYCFGMFNFTLFRGGEKGRRRFRAEESSTVSLLQQETTHTHIHTHTLTKHAEQQKSGALRGAETGSSHRYQLPRRLKKQKGG